MSEKTVAQKLGLKAGRTLFVSGAPAPIRELIGPLPDGADITEAGEGRFALVLAFAKDRAALVKVLPACKPKLEPGGALWIAYAKATSAKASDINRDTIRECVATMGLDTVSQIAIDRDWSALRLKLV